MSIKYKHAVSRERACEVCQAGQTSTGTCFLGRVKGYRIFRCPACKLSFVYPKPTPAQLDSLYAGYHAETQQLQLSQAGEQQLFHTITDTMQERGAQGELLDIGASYGHFLDMARRRGFAVKGIEIASEPCRYAREVLNLDVECKDLFEAMFEPDRFGAITMLNVLEHVAKPHEVLEECRRIAKAGAVLTIVVPNFLFAYPYFAVTRRLGLEFSVPSSSPFAHSQGGFSDVTDSLV